ncbi:MAG: hypothetical protein A2283_24275 [Lentisphaerae bacterium RIFOXYA12_FULL_48_11]|nr:MAG: hypothetical protein A2283_24275 [Lentisphaerae bacterium RIFOXYA12_FULL_48_11]
MSFISRKDDSSAEQRTVRLHYVCRHWDVIALKCYEGFLDHGVGALVMNDAEVLENPDVAPEKITMKYLNEESLPPFHNKSQEAYFLATYFPEVSFLVSFLSTEKTWFVYRFAARGEESPKAIFERLKLKH